MTKKPVAVTFAVIAALAVPAVIALAPRSVPAQERPAEPAKPPAQVRCIDVSGIATQEAIWGSAGYLAALPFTAYPDPERKVHPETEAIGPNVGEIVEFLRSGDATIRDECEVVVTDGATLLVRAPEKAIRRITESIDALRAASVPAEATVRSVTLPAGPQGDSLAAAVEALAGAPVPADLVARLVAADADGGARGGTASGPAGAWNLFAAVQTTRAITNWDVEIAQTASISDPVPSDVEEGLRAAIRADLLSDGRAVVTAAAAAGDAVKPFRRVEFRTKDLASAEMPEVRGTWSCSSAVLAPGETAAVLADSFTADRTRVRRVLLFTLDRMPKSSMPANVTSVPCRFARAPDAPRVWVGATRHGEGDEAWRPGLFVASREEQNEGPETMLRAATSELDARGGLEVGAAAAITAWPGGGSLVMNGPEPARLAAAAVAAQVEATLVRPAWISIRLVARDGSEERVVGAVSSAMLLGRGASFAATTEIAYVHDHDVEVAQEARIADPIPAEAVGGTVVNVRLDGAAGGALRAALDIYVASVGTPEPLPSTATEVGVTESVPAKRVLARCTVDVEPGRAKEIELGRNPFGPGRLVAVVRAALRK